MTNTSSTTTGGLGMVNCDPHVGMEEVDSCACHDWVHVELPQGNCGRRNHRTDPTLSVLIGFLEPLQWLVCEAALSKSVHL